MNFYSKLENSIAEFVKFWCSFLLVLLFTIKYSLRSCSTWDILFTKTALPFPYWLHLRRIVFGGFRSHSQPIWVTKTSGTPGPGSTGRAPGAGEFKSVPPSKNSKWSRLQRPDKKEHYIWILTCYILNRRYLSSLDLNINPWLSGVIKRIIPLIARHRLGSLICCHSFSVLTASFCHRL